jgi:hypothetical protein
MRANSRSEHAFTEADGVVRLDVVSIDAIAQRVADILRSESFQTREQLITATDVAARFGVSRSWVYDNAERLGAVRLGTGSKARLRFDPKRVSELMRAKPTARDQLARRSPQGEIEHACTVSETALARTGRLSSSRVAQLLEGLHAKLVPHAATPGVVDVVHSLSSALEVRAHMGVLIAATGNPRP